MPSWGWRQISKHVWRYDDRWEAQQDPTTKQWYAVRDGKWMLANFATAGEAINEAERLREADKLYAAEGGG